jgi:hypothetical protein
MDLNNTKTNTTPIYNSEQLKRYCRCFNNCVIKMETFVLSTESFTTEPQLNINVTIIPLVNTSEIQEQSTLMMVLVQV